MNYTEDGENFKVQESNTTNDDKSATSEDFVDHLNSIFGILFLFLNIASMTVFVAVSLQ